jgi:hypothetical protein
MVKDEIEHDNGKVIFNKSKYCGGDSQCNGIFYVNNNEDPVIKVAKGNLCTEEWVGILVHEYCHYCQWRDDCKIWNQFSSHDVNFETIFSNPKKHREPLIDLMHLELDCERRALKLIKANKLLDVDKYCKTANAVLFKYAFLFRGNDWPTSSKKYDLVYNASPTKLLQNVERYLYAFPEIISLYK